MIADFTSAKRFVVGVSLAHYYAFQSQRIAYISVRVLLDYDLELFHASLHPLLGRCLSSESIMMVTGPSLWMETSMCA